MEINVPLQLAWWPSACSTRNWEHCALQTFSDSYYL